MLARSSIFGSLALSGHFTPVTIVPKLLGSRIFAKSNTHNPADEAGSKDERPSLAVEVILQYTSSAEIAAGSGPRT